MTGALEEVAALVQLASGVVMRKPQLPGLRAAIARTAPSLDADGVLSELRTSRGGALMDRLVDEVTIKETFFFRHRDELDAIDLAAVAVRASMRGASRVRIWSAACATGEEPYTLAMLAIESFGSSSPPVDILGTDIASSALARAQIGRYGPRSTRHVEESQRSRWFRPAPGALEVGDGLRRLTRFRQHNLLAGEFPPAGEGLFDVIVCRNVLMYFEPQQSRAAIARLHTALVPGGVLLLGAADRLVGTTGPLPARLPPSRRRPVARTTGAPRPRRAAGHGARGDVLPSDATPELEAETQFTIGVSSLADGDAAAAVKALRRALYLEPGHAAAAFQLARAHEGRDDVPAARRAYWRALDLLDTADGEVAGVARQDLQAACRSRLATLGQV